ncbi:MAG: hypothetical protein NTX25_16825 [Proteobacteria bacterium]|nr:hypothetical protein [Pseudomonadota bacterium]
MNSYSSCVLRNLDNPLLNGLTLGLSFADDGQVSLQKDMFPCCSAEGLAWDKAGCGIRSCTVRGRLYQVQKLFYHYRKAWPHCPRLPNQVPATYARTILQEVGAVLKHDKAKAQISFTSQKIQPSMLWSKALASLWRFGVETRVINLQKIEKHELVRFTSDHHGPLALFVEQVDKLWDPLHGEAFEHLVHRAYNAEAFLWLEFLHEPYQAHESQNAEQDHSLKASFSRRISQKKASRHPFELLSRDCLSRLQSLSGQKLSPPSGDSHD